MAEAVPPGTGRIFISYRRQDTAYPAAWLFDRLTQHYGRGQVFKDVDSVQPGDDFVEVITSAVASCDVLLALIGSEWTTIADEEGRRRLDLPGDFVRLEIEEALKRDIKVIPLLVDGASMPEEEDLPSSLSKLVRRHALELSPSRFEFDTSRLLKVLDKTLGDAPWVQPAPARPAPLPAGDPTPPEWPEEEPEPEPEPVTDPVPTVASVVLPAAAEVHAAPLVATPISRPAPVDPPPPGGGFHPPEPPPPRPPPSGSSTGSRRWPLAVGLATASLLVLSALLVLSSRDDSASPPEAPGTTVSVVATTTATSPTTGKGDATPKVQSIKVGKGSSGVAIGRDDVWVSNYDEGTVTRLDPAGKVLDTVRVGKAGGDIVSCPGTVWVISDERSVARIDTATGRVAAMFKLGTQVVDLAARCGDAVWASGNDGTISRIREGAATAEAFQKVAPDLVADVDVDQQGVLWMSHTAGNALLRVDPKTKAVQRIAVGAGPIGVAASPEAIWVTGSTAGTVSKVDPMSNTVVDKIAVGKHPWGAAVGLGSVWVTNLGSNTVSRIDLVSKSVTTIDVQSKPDGIAVGHGAVWVANGGSGTISRIA